MKTSLLPILAGAMTVFAQGSGSGLPSPFKLISQALQEADPGLEAFDGSVASVTITLGILATLKLKVDAICNPLDGAIPHQSLPVQAAWLQDAQSLVEDINGTTIIIIEKRPLVEGALGQAAGDELALSMLNAYRIEIPSCVKSLRGAFDDSQGQQEALDAAQGNVTAILDKAIEAYGGQAPVR